MESNILANQFLNYTNEDLVFEHTLTKAIADNVNLSSVRRRDAFDKVAEIEEAMNLFAIAEESLIQHSGTGLSIVEAITGKTYSQLLKESAPSLARDAKNTVVKGVDSVANGARSAARALGSWLNKVGQEK